MSEREPELGLGLVTSVERTRIGVRYPATGEQRLYALGTPVLKRVQFQPGETIRARDGRALTVEAVAEADGLLLYSGGGYTVREDEVSDVTSISSPQERILAGQSDPCEVFDLRHRALQAQCRFRQSAVRGYLGGRIDLIPHQFYILHELSKRQRPRALLSDEVGLGKTIEACLIVQRLLAIGRARRVLILVPESLVHQWFVELLRRFNLWFSILDEERCGATEAGDPGANPYLASQWVLCSIRFVAHLDRRREQALAAGWDVLVVDEAHHLEWSKENASPEYRVVEQLAARTPGLLLLTATPTQLGLEGHFARLRLLDPDRFADYETFVQETEQFGEVASVADQIANGEALNDGDDAALRRIFNKDPERLAQLLEAYRDRRAGSGQALLRNLLDQHGTGRVVFRNTRAAVKGFPPRRFIPVALTTENSTLLARVARELEAEEAGAEAGIRYSFKEDPRIDWLADFLRAHKGDKVLLICRTQRKALALDAALKERINTQVALFHEGLALVQRDRNAAWFAEPDGAQLLICSEIGSEGRNFQFSHDLVLFDLPLNPALVEQRIGRLDRIGQTDTVRIHLPYLVGSADEVIVAWYHRGLNAFEVPLQSGSDYAAEFRTRVLALAAEAKAEKEHALEALIGETAQFRAELSARLQRGRDRLLELHSFNPAVAARLIENVQQADTDPFLRQFLLALLDHFGVRIKEFEGGDLFLDPSHAYVEAFPSIPADGMLATFKRERAIAREDMRFISADHPLVGDAIDLLVDSPAGTASFGTLRDAKHNLLIEAVFILEAVAETEWHVDQFLAPTPVRVVVDIRGNDLGETLSSVHLANDLEDEALEPFLKRPGFNGAVLKALVGGAEERAQAQAARLRTEARSQAAVVLSAELQRLKDLRRINPHVRLEEIDWWETQARNVDTAIAASRLRLDSLRLILQKPRP